MTTYHVVVTEGAEGEMDSVFQRLLFQSPDAAGRFQKGMDEAILSLSEMPRRCPFAPEDGLTEQPIRQLIYRHGRTAYRILFNVFDETEDSPPFVRVLRVRHGAQQHLGLATEQTDED